MSVFTVYMFLRSGQRVNILSLLEKGRSCQGTTVFGKNGS